MDNAHVKRVARALGLVFGISTVVAASGCAPAAPLDVVGVDETVLETRETETVPVESPTFDPELSVIEQFGACRMRVNKSAALTRLTIKALDGATASLADVIFPTRAEALAALGNNTVLPSMEVVNGALKPWLDGVYAAIERSAEAGDAGSLVNKRATLEALLGTMLERAAKGEAGATAAAVDLGAALRLSGADPDLPGPIAAQAEAAIATFDRDLTRAVPIGFYTWSDQLSMIFRRDRFLQGALGVGRIGIEPAAAVARALASDRPLASSYERVLELYRGLTNPSRHIDPVMLMESLGDKPADELAQAEANFMQAHPELDAAPPCQAGFSWLPASDSPERKLFAAQTCAGMPPRNLLDALIGAIQAGAIDLTPTANSGFYDWQLYALETLLLPERSHESGHLVLTQKYRDKLVETFKALVTQARETHAKELEAHSVSVSLMIKPQPVDVYPALAVEPFPTFYLRTARGLAFLHNVLKAVLGEAALNGASRLFEDGASAPVSLETELTEKTRLLYGLHMVSAASIGMRDELDDDERAHFASEAESAARTWLEHWQSDPDVLRDPRVAVPLQFDLARQRTRSSAVVGVKLIQVSATFPKRHEPVVTWAGERRERPCALREFVPFEPYMLADQTLEFDRELSLGPLTREGLRAALRGKRTLAQIKSVLEAP